MKGDDLAVQSLVLRPLKWCQRACDAVQGGVVGREHIFLVARFPHRGLLGCEWATPAPVRPVAGNRVPEVPSYDDLQPAASKPAHVIDRDVAETVDIPRDTRVTAN